MVAEDFFAPWEREANGWEECLAAINHILDLAGRQRDLAWRGVWDSSYALHSSLYRRFLKANTSPPDEGDLVKFEENLLSASRRRWRYDNLSALEIFAHLQHYGGPTR